MSNFTHIAWTDLETTGLNPEKDDLLEVGIILTDLELNVIADKSWLVRPKKLDLLHIDPVVMKMYTENGLLDAIVLREPAPFYDYTTDWCVDGVNRQIGTWVRHKMDRETDAWTLGLGGSGVSHFDIRWIKKHLPSFGRLLYRSTVDVGVIRRFIEHVVQRPELIPEAFPLTHRALDDARQHLAEARIYREMLREVAAMDEARQSS